MMVSQTFLGQFTQGGFKESDELFPLVGDMFSSTCFFEEVSDHFGVLDQGMVGVIHGGIVLEGGRFC